MGTHLHIEKRSFGRQTIEGLDALLSTDDGRELSGQIVDIGSGGLSLRVRRGLRVPMKDLSRVQIRQIGPFSFDAEAEVAWTRQEEPRQLRLGLKTFQSRSILEGVDFRETSRQFDILHTEKEVSDFVQDMVLLSGELPVHVQWNGRSFRGIFEHRSKLKTVKQLTIRTPGLWSAEKNLSQEEALCSVEIFDTFYAFYAPVLKVEEGAVQIGVPNRIVRLYRRALSRLTNPGDFELRMSTPQSPTDQESFRFYDLHETGGSILVSHSSGLLPVGLVIPNASILADGKILSNIQVRVVAAVNTEAGILTQLRFSEHSQKPISTFAKTIIEKRYPSIRDAYANDFGRFWDLLEGSGYVSEREGGVIEQSKLQAKATWSSAMETQFGIARNFGIVDQDKYTGGAHLTQFYPDTWLFHQLAILPGKQGGDMPLLYCAIADFMAARKAKYVLGFFNADHSWTQKTYMSFLETYPYPEDNHFERFETYQVDLKTFKSDAPRENLRPASKYDLKRIVRYFQTNHSEMYRDALDLETPEGLEVEDLAKEYEAVGLYRKRKFFVLEKDDKLVAFAMADIASGGLNVFSLCDSFQIFHVEPQDVQDVDEKALIGLVAEWYRSFEKSEALYMSSRKIENEEDWPGLTWVVSLNYWIAKSSIFARYKSHIRRLFGRIQTRKRKVRERIKAKKKATQ